MMAGIVWRDKPTLSVRRVQRFPDGWTDQLILRIRWCGRTVIPVPLVELVTGLGVAFGTLPSARGNRTVISEEVAERIKSSVENWKRASVALERAELSGPFTAGRSRVIEDSHRTMDAAIASLEELLVTGDRARLLW